MGFFAHRSSPNYALYANIDDPEVTEGDSGSTPMVFTVTFDRVFDQDVKFDYTTAGVSATSGTDFTSATGTATLLKNATQATISINITGDLDVESDETLTCTLSNFRAA